MVLHEYRLAPRPRPPDGLVSPTVQFARHYLPILAILLLFGTIQETASGQASQPSRVVLEEDAITLETDAGNGTILAIRDRASGIALTSPPGVAENFRLTLLQSDQKLAASRGTPRLARRCATVLRGHGRCAGGPGVPGNAGVPPVPQRRRPPDARRLCRVEDPQARTR